MQHKTAPAAQVLQCSVRPRTFPAAARRPRQRSLLESDPGETTKPALKTLGLLVTHGTIPTGTGRPRRPARQPTS
jgi:hypothetical protein